MPVFAPPAQLLPHRPPMLLIDRVLEWNNPRLKCQVTIPPDSLFVEDGRVSAVVAIEYMVQAVGAYVGLNRRAKGKPIRIGYLLGTRELTLNVDYFAVGDQLTIDVEHLFGEDRLGSFLCVVLRNQQSVASAVLNVFQNSDEEMIDL